MTERKRANESQRFEQLRARRRQSAEEIGERERWIALQHFCIVDASNPGELRFKMQNGPEIGISTVKVSKSAPQQRKQFRLVMIGFRAELYQFDKIGCGL